MNHNAEIAAAAKSVLGSIGCERKGRSRLWLDDHGWWVGVIEFQSSGWSKGSYLNVAVSYLWKPAFAQASLTFDAVIGPRTWYDAVEGESFTGKAMELATIARDSLTSLRGHHRTIALAADWLQRHWVKRSIWQDFHLGLALGLSGRVESAQRHFRLAAHPLPEDEWVAALGRECEMYATLVEDSRVFRATVLERIQVTRSALKFGLVNLQGL